MILPDIQGTKPKFTRHIQEVGVDNVKVPIKIQLRDYGVTQIVANVSMRTNLDENIKGSSMSRLIRTLRKFIDKPLKKEIIKDILFAIREKIESKHSFIHFSFEIPVKQKSPISDYSFPIYHACSWEGQLVNDEFTFYQKVVVQYASYCPCSNELVNALRANSSNGLAHAQRAFAYIIFKPEKGETVLLEEVIDIVKNAVKNVPVPIIKRVDEQEMARIAAENPMFVEDAIRAIAHDIDDIKNINDYFIKCVHEENIHTSEATSVIYKGVAGGFDSSTSVIFME